VNRDFARLDLTGLEVDALRRVGTVGLGRAYGAQDIGMFVAGGVYVDLLGKSSRRMMRMCSVTS